MSDANETHEQGAKRHRVVVVGSINVDEVVLVDHLPAAGETVTGGRLQRHQGGKSANQAVAAARLGAATAFVGAVGDDAAGDAARAALAAEGIDVAPLSTLEGELTGVALILVDRAGENCIAVASEANGALRPEHVRDALAALELRPGDVLLAGTEVAAETTAAALAAGREAGATTVLNPAPATGLGAGVLALADVITPNAGELAQLVGETPERHEPTDLARRLLGPAPEGRAVLVTLGAAGALLVTGDRGEMLPAHPVRPVDTVGAGDTLSGALAAGLADGRPLADAARLAVVAASLSVTREGARGGMPTREDLEAALARA